MKSIKDGDILAERTIYASKMCVTWAHQNNRVLFTATAPTTGWVAVGFNLRNHIVGANLIMAAVIKGNLRIDDRYVVRMGQHQTTQALGGKMAASSTQFYEKRGVTMVQFSLPQLAIDRFHFDLLPNSDIFMILAYSREDDFYHHSIMRKHIQVTL